MAGQPWTRLLLVGAFTVLSGPVAAQSGDLTINIDNSHFNPVAAGGLADYVVRIDNAGNVASAPTTITFTVPEDTDYAGVDGLDCNPATGSGPHNITCDVPGLGAGGQVEARVNLRHMAEGTSALGASLPGGTSFSRTTTVLRGADLSVSLAADPSTIQAGNYGEFVATITNNGPYPSSGARLDVTIPTGMSSDFALPAGCSVSGTLLSCEIGDLPVGGEIVFSFSSQATATEFSNVTMSATLQEGEPSDPVADNDTATADLEIVPGTDVSLDKTRAPLGLILVGDSVSFTLEPGFVGQEPTQATITDTVPANYQVVGATGGNGWSCAVTGQAVFCTFAGGPGTSYEDPIVIEATAIAAGQDIENVADIVSADENDGADGNNTASDGRADIAEPIIDLVAYKSGPDRGLVTVGNSYDFGLRTRNEGNSDFSGELTITDHLPAGLTVTAIDAPAGWTCPSGLPLAGPQDIVCTTGIYTAGNPLGPFESSDTISLTAEVTQEGSISNGMTVSFDNYGTEDSEPSNNTTATGLTSAGTGNWADVRVIKTQISPAPVVPTLSGDPVTFRIEIVNDGPATAADVIMTDRLDPVVNSQGGEPTSEPATSVDPQGMGMVCAVPKVAAYARELECTVAALPVCTPGVDCPSVEVTVYPGESGTQTNTAVAYSYETPDNDTSNNESSVNHDVEPRTDLVVTKASPSVGAGAAVGQELTYVVTAAVPENGLSDAQDVTVTDTLPDNLRFISATPSVGSCSVFPASGEIVSSPNNAVQCELGTIVNGAQQTVTIVVVPTLPLVGLDIANSAQGNTSTTETDTDNNSAFVTVGIIVPELDLLVVGKTDDPDPVKIDTDVVYSITLQNLGPSDATDVVLTDTLPSSGLANPRLPATLPEGWDCQLSGHDAVVPGGTLTCNITYMPAGSQGALELTMQAMVSNSIQK